METDIDKIDAFFANRPESLKLFNAVRACIETLGPSKIEVMKTQISFGAKRKFAWVWLPQTWIKKRPGNSITLTFYLRRRIVADKIESAVEPRPGYWTHHVIIQKETDLDEDVRNWLREAYITRGL